ncbi:MAG: VWA domain-containing protein, partial [Pseudomonadota bacterium]
APEDEEETLAFDDRSGTAEPPEPGEIREAGADATAVERLTRRSFAADPAHALRRFRRDAATALPRRISRRRAPSRRGPMPDMRRALREAARHDGEVMRLPMRARRTRARRVLLLLDVSGSMKAQTEGALRAAHALTQTGVRIEVFTLGTRLTRITRALQLRNPEQAFANAAGLVADWDGGTRLGEALQAFLAVPRFAGHARGALVLTVSDGLERGPPGTLVDAVARLSRLAWRLVWLTPLASGPGFQPQTQALSMAAPHIDAFDSAADLGRLCTAILEAGRETPRARRAG